MAPTEMSPKKLFEKIDADDQNNTPDEDVRREEWIEECRRRIREMVKDKAWSKLSANVVVELLDDDDDDMCQMSEREIYDAVMKWLIENQSQIASQIDRLMGIVRFSSMSTEDKFKCLDEAKRLQLHWFVKPYIMDADWYRTCIELNMPQFTELVEYDRSTPFVGEGRRARAIESHLNTVKPRSASVSALTVETKPSALQKAQSGKINAGTMMPRPRPQSVYSPSSHQTSHGKVLQSQSQQPGIRGRLPSEHLQYWREQMHALAETSNDQQQRPKLENGSRFKSRKENRSQWSNRSTKSM